MPRVYTKVGANRRRCRDFERVAKFEKVVRCTIEYRNTW